VAGSLAIGFMAYANYGLLLQVFEALSAGRR
jgi:hypothetical protein